MLNRASSLSPSPRTRTTQKSKHIKKSLDDKLALVYRQDRDKKKEMHIYVDSSDEEINPSPEKQGKSTAMVLRKPFKTEPNEPLSEQLSSSESEEKKDEEYSISLFSVLSFKPSKNAILYAEEYKAVKEVDFELYTTFLSHSKIYGSLLVNELGRIIWCDKTTHELLEGSLNNFDRVLLPQLLLFVKLDGFLTEMREIKQYNEKTVLSWIVYSKNSKRRYFKVPLPAAPTKCDIFYRFLKCLTVRVRPISISLPQYRDPNGYCNENLLSINHPTNCFFFELRNSEELPSLQGVDILNDPIIKKFLKHTKDKQSKYYSASQELPFIGKSKTNSLKHKRKNEMKGEVKEQISDLERPKNQNNVGQEQIDQVIDEKLVVRQEKKTFIF